MATSNIFKYTLFCFFGLCIFVMSLNCNSQHIHTKEPITYANLSAIQKSLFDEFINMEIPEGAKIDDVLTNTASIRNKVRLAEALLFRNANGDRQKAITILTWLLQYQNQDEQSKDYGVWSSSALGKKFDQNWREFIGCELILILENNREDLPSDLLKSIEIGLRHAAKGAAIRDVRAEYTNISIMSAFLMEYIGYAFDEPKLISTGAAKAKAIYGLYQKYKTFGEYNSPTYYGVTMVGIALWRKYAHNAEMRKMGEELERDFWHEIATFYHAGLQNMPGPYFRSYGMDMQKYNAIIGIWIALALDGKYAAPLPRTHGAKYFELSNIAPILHLGWQVPEDDLDRLKKFDTERFETREVMSGNSIKNVSMLMKEHWMMGGLWGNKRSWSQIKTGTIHWKNKDDICWLLVPGDGRTNVRVTEKGMHIFLANESATEIDLYVYADGLSESAFKKNKWELPGMDITIKTKMKMLGLRQATVMEIRDKYSLTEDYPMVMHLTFQVPKYKDANKPLIELYPQE